MRGLSQLAWLQSPRFEDPRDTERAAIVWVTAWVGLVVCGMQALFYAFQPITAQSVLYIAPELVCLVAALVAIRRGYVRSAAAAILALLTSMITVFVFFGGGMEMSFPPLLGSMAIMGALMLGVRAGVVLTVWGLLCTAAVFVVGSSDVMLIEGQDRSAIVLTVQLINVLLGGTLVTYAVHRLSQALQAERTHAQAAERSNQRLRSSRRLVQDVLQSMAEAVVVADEDDRIRIVNDAALSLLGAPTAEQLTQQPVSTLFDGSDLAQLDASATLGSTARGEGTLSTLDDRHVPVRIARSVIRGEGGEPLQIYVLSDIRHMLEARKRSEEAAAAAQSANQAKSTFLANMSHELRTPLNAVIGYSDMLLDDLQDDEQRSDVAQIRTAGSHLLSLINDVLDMSKVEAGRMEVYYEWVSLETLLGEVTAAIGPTARSRGTAVDVERPAALDRVVSDARKLKQILMNLASNAVKFTEGGRVIIRVGEADGQLRFEVEDTGIGIEPEKAALLFQPFVQADGSTSRRYGGTGLGLALSRRFAELLDGQLTVRSTPGMGSTFTLELPIPPADVHPTDVSAPPLSP